MVLLYNAAVMAIPFAGAVFVLGVAKAMGWLRSPQ